MPIRRRLSLSKLSQLIAEIEPLKYGFDHLSFPTVITDKDAIILYANEAVYKQTGFTPTETIGKNPAELWGGQMTPEFYQKMWDAILARKMPYVGEMKNKTKDGREYWQELQISPVLTKDNEVRFFIGIEPNITDRKEREKFREEFLSLLAHQLRNPLTSIRWSLSVLLEKGGLTPDQKSVLQEIYQDDRLLIDLIADFLVITRIGSLKPHPETIDFAEVIDQIVRRTKGTYPHVSFVSELTGPLPFLTGTKQLVSQVFANLIVNAAKYCDDTAGKVAVSFKKETDRYVFAVENNGPPIPSAERDKIFTKLYRGANATSRNKSGTGLGLYVVKLICDNLGWQVSFESPKAGGNTTVFTVSIPVEPKAF